MKWLFPWLASACLTLAAPLDDFIAAAKVKRGEEGEKAARFLVENMPAGDKAALSSEFLAENLDLAFQAREEFPWAKQVPEKIFFNDVLPYAVFDETREAWRGDFLEKARPIVKDAKTATEAVQALNRGFFNLVNVHYNTGRKAPNQSPSESMALGKATCTGLSIILVDACRAVGIPARAVGTPMWSNGRGNHTWVEIWDGGWHFTGADEYDKEGLDRGWFVNDAAQAKANVAEHAIYATSWKKEGLSFPLVWAEGSKEVAAVNVTGRYAAGKVPGEALAVLRPNIAVRLREGDAGGRIAAAVWLTTPSGRKLMEGATKAGRADLNDMPRFPVALGDRYRLRFDLDGKPVETAIFTVEKDETTLDLRVEDLEAVPGSVAALADGRTEAGENLSKEEAMRLLMLTHEMKLETQRESRARELQEKSIKIGDKTLRWEAKVFGKAPADGRSLWISMHGGGGAPPRVNDRQWKNQIGLYEPAEGIYVAPRAPTDTWNLWHEGHVDPLFERLIEDHVALEDVNPDKVYLMGYSAGGDGVWQLAPRMADRFAAAAMMAGHPNEARLDGLRNLPFAIFMGAKDAAYDRNKIAAERAAELDKLEQADPGGYIHMSRIYEGLGHWMERKDAEALPWLEKFRRDPWPEKIVWLQDDVTRDRFYWLKIPDKAAAKAGQRIMATLEGQEIRLEGEVPGGTEVRLSDALLDLDRPLSISVNGKEAWQGKASRSARAIRITLDERLDLPAAATAIVTLP